MGRVGPQATVSELSLIRDIIRDSLMELLLQHMDSQIGCRSVASINAHTPVRTAEIWTKCTFHFLKAFLSLNRND